MPQHADPDFQSNTHVNQDRDEEELQSLEREQTPAPSYDTPTQTRAEQILRLQSMIGNQGVQRLMGLKQTQKNPQSDLTSERLDTLSNSMDAETFDAHEKAHQGVSYATRDDHMRTKPQPDDHKNPIMRMFSTAGKSVMRMANNTISVMQSGLQISRCGTTHGVEEARELGSPGSVRSPDVSVDIDKAERPVTAGRGESANLIVEGTTSVSSGVAAIYRYEGDPAACDESGTMELAPIMLMPVVAGKFKFSLPWQLGTTPGIGRCVLVKAGDGTNYNIACARVTVPESED